jgi:hypothetical protein
MNTTLESAVSQTIEYASQPASDIDTGILVEMKSGCANRRALLTATTDDQRSVLRSFIAFEPFGLFV